MLPLLREIEKDHTTVEIRQNELSMLGLPSVPPPKKTISHPATVYVGNLFHGICNYVVKYGVVPDMQVPWEVKHQHVYRESFNKHQRIEWTL